ncbi:MAG: ATP-grasp domain-containing protein [Reyranella sp.]|nr:ATP-grasp domain-containing protein [Reyranella sp.]
MAIRRLFVANRGEIALRIVRAARALGIESVLGASAADAGSLAAREAGRTVVIGPAPAKRSYLDAKLIVHAAKATGCDALHPGYGFLSERAELATLCAENGIAFVGPTAQSIEQVGGKIAARELARSVGVPLVEGSGKVGSTEEALQIAQQIGYPVVTKASAGGGGRGMVVVRDADALSAAFERASLEAKEAFGDGTLFLEHYVEKARHIEVQALGDGNGTVLHFGERDCSAQRRYQKMIEEAPAAILPDGVRSALRESAVKLLSSIRYRNAGTIEFLYDVDQQKFHFIEVNARIQVEHPVSETICGVDLIQLQLRIAGGEALPMAQADVQPRGHAIEVRIIAEDPDRNFTPSPGRIAGWRPPQGEGVRLDTAMFEGAVVPPFYDSMIAKLIVSGADRGQAVERLARALADFQIGGIATNLPLLRFIAAHPDFVENRITTRWLEQTVLPAYANRS